MLTPSKKIRLLHSLKSYKKKYLDKNISELDESGTRLMINSFLSDVLEYVPIDEIKTEYMIKGTYADYVIQLNGQRRFLVEVKALSFQLTAKHLRQTVNYGANEGIEWALLTNGKSFDLYKIIFNQPIESFRVFSIDLSDASNLKQAVNYLQFLHRDSVQKKGLKLLWNKCEATDPMNIASILYTDDIISVIRKLIRNKSGEKCAEEDIIKGLNILLEEKIDPTLVKRFRIKENKSRKTLPAKPSNATITEQTNNSPLLPALSELTN